MKILHVDTGDNWRGGQQQAVYLHEGLMQRGIETSFVCRPGSQLEKYFIRKGLPCKTAGLRSEMDLLSALKIASMCRCDGYDILHLHTAHALGIGLLAKLFCREVKVVGVRRVDFHIKNNPFSRMKYNTGLLDRLVCISGAIQKVVLEDGVPGYKTAVIHSGVDIHKFDGVNPEKGYRRGLGVPDDHLLVGTVAALVDHKDYPNLLMAAEKVLAAEEKVSFCAAGSGKKEDELKTLASRMNLNGRFHFLGYRSDVGKLLKSFDIFVLASKEEGLGTSVLDAEAVGLPIVGTTAGGIPEAINHGENGLIVPAMNPRALAEAILKLVRDETLREQYGEASLRVVKSFDVSYMVERNIELYHELAGSASAPQNGQGRRP